MPDTAPCERASYYHAETATVEHVQAGSQEPTCVIRDPRPDAAQAASDADAKLLDLHRRTGTLELTLPGNPALLAESPLSDEGVGQRLSTALDCQSGQSRRRRQLRLHDRGHRRHGVANTLIPTHPPAALGGVSRASSSATRAESPFHWHQVNTRPGCAPAAARSRARPIVKTIAAGPLQPVGEQLGEGSKQLMVDDQAQPATGGQVELAGAQAEQPLSRTRGSRRRNSVAFATAFSTGA